MEKLELVAPGGSLEKIEYAYHFGADAIYVGHPNFSLRARINEFDEKKLEKAVKLARILKKKIYFTLNIYAHERHLPKIEKHLKFIKKVKPDAVIVSDPGILNLIREIRGIRIHLSTQANTTNSEAVKFWEAQGISRIILAREVTLGEIRKIRKKCPKVGLEYFVHGAMCMSLSGRCLLSSWLRNRSANLGDCAQPCRWPYRGNWSNQGDLGSQGKIFEVQEDEHGAYLFNSKDLCLIEHLDELAKAGVDSFKIEGRTKSVCYVACAAKAYRQVLDAIKSGKNKAEIEKISVASKKELDKLTNRGYSTGFLFGKDKWENNVECSHKKNQWQFVGEIIGEAEKSSRVHPVKSPTQGRGAALPQFHRVKVHNALEEKEKVEIITPREVFSDKVGEIRKIGKKGEDRVISAHGGSQNIYLINFSRVYPEKSLLRKKT